MESSQSVIEKVANNIVQDIISYTTDNLYGIGIQEKKDKLIHNERLFAHILETGILNFTEGKEILDDRIFSTLLFLVYAEMKRKGLFFWQYPNPKFLYSHLISLFKKNPYSLKEIKNLGLINYIPEIIDLIKEAWDKLAREINVGDLITKADCLIYWEDVDFKGILIDSYIRQLEDIGVMIYDKFGRENENYNRLKELVKIKLNQLIL